MNIEIIDVSSRDFENVWLDLKGRQIERDALYCRENIEFYKEQRQQTEIDDSSFIAAAGSKGIVGVRMQAFRLPEELIEISCHGLPCLFGENPDCDLKLKGAARKIFKREFLSRISRNGPVGRLQFRDYLDGGDVSFLGRLLLTDGASASPHFSQVIDLAPPLSELKSSLSKTVRWSINWGFRELEISVLDKSTITSENIDEFRALHIEASGRETRSRRTWDRQLDLVKAGSGFVVSGRLEDQLVTAALFVRSEKHCYYGVSASNRELFDKPISHAVIWSAIEYARNDLGLRFFEMGQQIFPGLQQVQPTAKERGISFFKRSFGGETEVSLDLMLNNYHPHPNGKEE